MPATPSDSPLFLHADDEYQPLLRAIGLDAEGVFADPRIVPWRRLEDRENCTMDAEPGALWRSPRVRLHVKRYVPARGESPALAESRGHALLASAGVPTAPLVAWGGLSDGRGFAIFLDLVGYRPADKLVEAGRPFASLLAPTAELAARLHRAGLHHRDLYLCHFMLPVDETADPAPRLIDVARVRALPGPIFRRRWIVKDLAQFWYSTLKLPVTDDQRLDWLARYGSARGLSAGAIDRLRRSIERKARAIARHDRRLNRDRPTRNVSIPA